MTCRLISRIVSVSLSHYLCKEYITLQGPTSIRMGVLLLFSALITSLVISHFAVAEQTVCQCSTPSNAQLLYEFYIAVGGPSYWNFTQSVCQWSGVGCSGPVVTSLYVSLGGNLGTLPASLSSLDSLQSLVISCNSALHGTIPPSYGNFVSLTTLSIDGCQLSGVVPDSFKNLVNLRNLSLTNNFLGGSFPDALLQLPQLIDLSLAGNQFNGMIPNAISNMNSLSSIDLSSNRFAELPASFSSLKNLASLSLQGNSFSGSFPVALLPLSLLASLSLASNSFRGSLPEAVAGMYSLQSLDLSDNQFVGPIPSGLSNLTLLQYLHLAKNKDLQLNSDTVPPSFGNLGQLRVLTLSNTNFTDGTFPPALCSLVNLTSLDVSSSQLRGSIPQCLSSFANIEILNMGTSAFNTTIPSFVYKLRSLAVLQCANCLLLGPLNVTDFTQLSALQHLALDSNNFSGSIDASIGLLSNLVALSLSSCGLTGSIPDTIGQLTNLTFLILSSNSLTGTFPSTIVNCKRLQQVIVRSNLLSGTVPVELSSLKHLEWCCLGSNMFSGTIPSFLVNMTSLQAFYLDHNHLTGSLPKALPPQLSQMSLSGNNISGGLPQAWYKSSLTILDVSNNSLSGILPPVWGLKTNWEWLILSNNHLVGVLPSLWAALRSLQSLELKSNALGGLLPPQWGIGMVSLKSPFVAQSKCFGDVLSSGMSLGYGNPRLCGGVPRNWTNRAIPMPSDRTLVNQGACTPTRFITTPPPRLSRRVTLRYCSIACDRAAPGFFPATPQTDEELADMTAVATNASHVARYLLLGGGMIPSDPTTLRWLSGALGDTGDGDGTIFYVEDALPQRRCVTPCKLNTTDPLPLPNQQLLVDSNSGQWVVADVALYRGYVGCMCQDSPRSIHPFGFFRSTSVSIAHTRASNSTSTSNWATMTHSRSPSKWNLSITSFVTVVLPPTSSNIVSQSLSVTKGTVSRRELTVTVTTFVSRRQLTTSRRRSISTTHSDRLSIVTMTQSLTVASDVADEASNVVIVTTAITSFATAAAAFRGASTISLTMVQTVAQMLALMDRCRSAASSSSPLMSDVVDNPLQIRWKVFGGDLKYATGSVLSNVVMGTVLLCCRWVSEHLTQPQQRHLLTVGRRLPGSTLAPVAAVLQPLVAASVVHVGSGLRGGSPGAVAFGGTIVCVLMAYVGWLVRTVALNRALPLVCAEVNDDAPRRQFLQRICFTSREWTTAPCDGEEHEAAAEYLERYGDVVAPYRGGRHWFFAIELATSWFVATVSGVSMALPQSAACSYGVPSVLTSLQLVGSVALCVLCLLLKPFDVPLEGLLFVVQLLLTSGALVIVLASDQSSASANGLMLAQSLITFVVAIALMAIALRRSCLRIGHKANSSKPSCEFSIVLKVEFEANEVLTELVQMACASHRVGTVKSIPAQRFVMKKTIGHPSSDNSPSRGIKDRDGQLSLSQGVHL